MDERKRYDEGMKTRRSVLGDAHVDRTLKNRSKFNEPFQELITRYAWGEIWQRPGLDDRRLVRAAPPDLGSVPKPYGQPRQRDVETRLDMPTRTRFRSVLIGKQYQGRRQRFASCLGWR